MSAPNGDVVDLLIADHLPKFLGADATIAGTPVLSMLGGAQAVERSMQVRLIDDRSGTEVTIRIPDLLGALILKSAAYSADHAGYGDRHLYDAAMLVSLIPDPDAELVVQQHRPQTHQTPARQTHRGIPLLEQPRRSAPPRRTGHHRNTRFLVNNPRRRAAPYGV